MSTNVNRSADRRKAARHARNLQISWRVLGNRDYHFGEAALKNIGAQGMALRVDRHCPNGTLVIVQFEIGRGSVEPMLLRTEWSGEAEPAKGGTVTYLVGCSFTTPLSEEELKALLECAQKAAAARGPRKTAAAPEPAPGDPFLVGSVGERRSLARRAGVVVPVAVYRAHGGTRIEGAVVDRSLKGLGILMPMPITRGTQLKVRPSNAPEKIPYVEVQVRNCRQKSMHWLLGCDFPQTPRSDVLMLLG
jgi:hypothetical protein